MPVVFVARSAAFSKWGADVGLGKNLFRLGMAADAGAVAELLKAHPCGCDDWTVVRKQEVEAAEEMALLEGVAKKEKRVDPALYPRLRGDMAVFKVKQENVENHLFMKNALDGFEPKDIKVKAADIAAYLLHLALR